ncbi:MAG: HupE/UreJ family protein, partial [Myxococcales bacterium]|nr:HupE/UreJ family protein [Myxococcales bacterium]
MRQLALTWLLVGGILAGVPMADAHQRSMSYSIWELDDHGARVHARVSQLDLSRLGLAYLGGSGPDESVSRYLANRLTLRAGDDVCRPAWPPALRDEPEGWLVYAWRVDCDSPSPRTITSVLFLEAAPSHLHFTQVTTADGESRERVLSEADPSWTLPTEAGEVSSHAGPSAGAGSSLLDYIELGTEHILTGWDHLAFVLALLLLASRVGEVVTLVTAFTVAHSITLGLATLQIVQPEAAAVEALIGFSIALVAAENVWLLGGRRGWIPLGMTAGLLLLALLPGGAVSRLALAGLALFCVCHFGLLRLSDRPERLRAGVAFAFGLAAASFFPVILLGIFDKRTNRTGAVAGMIVGIVFTAVYIVGNRSDKILGTAEPLMGEWCFGISAEGIGTIGC